MGQESGLKQLLHWIASNTLKHPILADSSMRGSAPPTGGNPHEQAVSSALDLICSSTEQTYPQFLASFTHLIPEAPGSETGRNTQDAVAPETRCDGQQSKSQSRATSVGEEDNSGHSGVSSLLPGEVEPETSAPPPPSIITHSTQLQMSSTANPTNKPNTNSSENMSPTTALNPTMTGGDHTAHGTSLPLVGPTMDSGGGDADMPMAHTVTSHEQVEWEDIQPFELNEDFDYDNVVLTHKYSTLPQRPKAN
ncbi:intraflagellar transport-associated protein isoform X3 [Engraulis encrasicolus]|uniref:intraflagellar transport-associated protein isoform X3 n=1 Tax=Engraulis encrasicolus TaxID=184585 RepID=UPI002FD67598